MKWVLENGPALIIITAIAWSGNAIVGRGVIEAIPPTGLAFWRWSVALPIFLIISWPHLKKDLPELIAGWKYLLILSFLSIAVYNTFIYQGLTTTTAINSFLINTSRPVIIVFLSFLIFRERVTLLQISGLLLAFIGTGIIIARGDIELLQRLQFNGGDFWVLTATIAWAFYTVLLPKRPKVHPASFLAAGVLIGLVIILPFYVWETVTVRPVPLSLETAGAALFLGTVPTVIAYMTYNKAVEVIGANRAGLTSYLLPVFGVLLAVLLLDEVFRQFHAAGIALILAGVLLAARRNSRS